MNTFTKLLSSSAAILAASAVYAQYPSSQAPSYQERPYQESAYQPSATVSQQELDQILAPVALYPDSLLSQLLMAATYPQDVAEAANWSRANPDLRGDDAVRAVEGEQWAPSVKSLVAFPEVLATMGDQPQWTQRLGEAFLAQETAVLQTVQQLRRRADEAGNLRSNDRMAVQREGDNYLLAPASPEVVHVPYYDPRVVYGSWWWPSYRPVYWNPWPGYAYYGGVGFGWGRGIVLRSGFFYGGFDWGRRYVRYSGHRPYYYGGNTHYGRGWHDNRNDGRRYTQYRSPGTQPRYGSQGRPQYQDRSQNQVRPQYQDRPQYGDGGRTVPRPERVDGSPRAYNPSVRTVAPRVGIEGARPTGTRTRVERPATATATAPVRVQVQGVPSAQGTVKPLRVIPQSNMPNAPVQPNRVERRTPVAPAAQPVQRGTPPTARVTPVAPPAARVSQPSERVSKPAQVSADRGRGGGGDDRGADRGGGRGRDR